ncbi:MAG: hypothetical protein IJ317_05000, partial [Clostridia bacterium]|nr:hypothetical protein [Clostridia bacterium]
MVKKILKNFCGRYPRRSFYKFLFVFLSQLFVLSFWRGTPRGGVSTSFRPFFYRKPRFVILAGNAPRRSFYKLPSV